MSIILGIESTAHTFGIGIVKNGRILSNVKRVFTTEEGGMIPLEVAKFHCENKNEIYFEALDGASIKESEIDVIAFSQGPGLAPCLLEGMKFAKELSKRLDKPIVPVNHCIAHLEIGRITKMHDAVMLYTSGANTQIIAYASGRHRVFGETLDVGVGNFIDNFARYAGIGFPGGSAIEKLALKGKKYIELPYSVKGMDVALSGILTNLRQKLEGGKYSLSNLAYSMQETVFAMLVETAERALAHTGKKELLLGGGVACNFRLQEMCKIMCKERGAKFFVPEKSLLVDNGAMIAYLGEIMFNNGNFTKPENIDLVDIKPRQRTDDVEVSWRD
ncbi:MAG: KEOPS complex N(6)-L-threonylcarbamoyladenine synthase Kae1 [Nanoarchaeota archaeon]